MRLPADDSAEAQTIIAAVNVWLEGVLVVVAAEGVPLHYNVCSPDGAIIMAHLDLYEVVKTYPIAAEAALTALAAPGSPEGADS